MLASSMDMTTFADSRRAITHYFQNQRCTKHRYEDYVVLPVAPTLLGKEFSTLDYDSDSLMSMSKNTIDMLSRLKTSNVYPFPLIPNTPAFFANSQRSELDRFSIKHCQKAILEEKQYGLHFHVVGHGTTRGVGILDPHAQLSPEQFAQTFDAWFETHHLAPIKQRPISFTFHTCNSAFVEVTLGMGSQDILNKIAHESFIGIFQKALRRLGFANAQVNGFRGYYVTVGAGALVMSETVNPQYEFAAHKAQFTVSNEGCNALAPDGIPWRFPVSNCLPAVEMKRQFSGLRV